MSNVTQMHAAQPAPEAKPARFTISAELDGFPVSIEIEGKADALKALVERLKVIGAQPPQARPTAQPGVQNAPRCPVHNKLMKPSRKPGSFFCPGRNEDGSYCDHNA
jgi:hypothetical protein